MKTTFFLPISLWLLLWIPTATGEPGNISCLRRIEPLGGVILLAGPSSIAGGSTVITELKVAEGEWVEKDQVLAVLDDYKLRAAEVSRQQSRAGPGGPAFRQPLFFFPFALFGLAGLFDFTGLFGLAFAADAGDGAAAAAAPPVALPISFGITSFLR